MLTLFWFTVLCNFYTREMWRNHIFYTFFVDAPSFSKRTKLICDFHHLNIPIKWFPVLVMNYEPRQREWICFHCSVNLVWMKICSAWEFNLLIGFTPPSCLIFDPRSHLPAWSNALFDPPQVQKENEGGTLRGRGRQLAEGVVSNLKEMIGTSGASSRGG